MPVLHPPLQSAHLTARSTHHDRDGLLLEKLKLSRGTTPWAFAEAHARGWAQTVRDAQTQPMIAAGTVAASFDHDLQAARARLTLWAAADTTILSRLSDSSVAVDRCILVPVYVDGEIMALVPDSGYFGVACTKGQLAEQSARLAREAGVSPSTNLVNVTMNSLEGRDYVFSAVAKAPLQQQVSLGRVMSSGARWEICMGLTHSRMRRWPCGESCSCARLQGQHRWSSVR